MALLSVFATALLAAAVSIPPECEPPELRDVLPLKQLAQLDGALSVGLDSVATWCFDPGGTWTAGVQPQPGKGKPKNTKLTEPVVDPSVPWPNWGSGGWGCSAPAPQARPGESMNGPGRSGGCARDGGVSARVTGLKWCHSANRRRR